MFSFNLLPAILLALVLCLIVTGFLTALWQLNKMINKNISLQNSGQEQATELTLLQFQATEHKEQYEKALHDKEAIQQENYELRETQASRKVELEQIELRRQDALQQAEEDRTERQLAQTKISALEMQLAEQKVISEEQYKNVLETKKSLQAEFESLSHKIFEDKSKSFTTASSQSLEALLKPFREQMNQFQSRVNEIHSDSVKENANLTSEIKKVMEVGMHMSQEADHLTQALKGNKKTLGNWGELQLEKSLQLAGLEFGTHYTKETVFKDAEGRNKRLDFVIYLPDDKHLVIDSKVSLVAYEQATAADNDETMTQALDEHVKAVKNHIISLADKEYTNLDGLNSPSFVLMFMPIEPAYTAALRHSASLFNFGFEKNVILVSHTSLLPILRTVANIWIMEQSNQETKEIADKAGDIYNQLCILAERLAKVGGTIETLSTQYNQTIKAIAGKQGLFGKVEKFDKLSSKSMKKMTQLNSLHLDVDKDKLDNLEAPLATQQAAQDQRASQEQATPETPTSNLHIVEQVPKLDPSQTKSTMFEFPAKDCEVDG